ETPAPAPATEAPRPDSGKHRLGSAPGLASLRRKDGPGPEPVTASPTAAPVDEAAMSHTSAALALPDDNQLPDDLPDDFPDSDELLAGEDGEDDVDEIEELEEIDDDIIEDEDEGDGEADDAAAAGDPGADEPDDDLPPLSGLDLEAPLSAA